MTLSLRLALLAATLLSLAAPLTNSGTPEIERVVESIQRSRGNPNAKAKLFQQLTAFNNRESFKALTGLTKSLQNPQVLQGAFLACETYRGHPEIESLVIEWIADQCGASRKPLRHAAAEGLTRFGKDAAQDLNRLLRKSKDEVVRAWALRPLLKDLQADGSQHSLKLAVENARLGPSGTHARFVEAFGSFTGDPNNTVFYASLRDTDIHPAVQVAIIEAIGQRDAKGMNKALLGTLKDTAPTVQLAAIAALDKRGEGVHGSALKKLIKSKDERVRRQAVISLGQIRSGDDDWADELKDLAKHKNPEVRMGAVVALAELRTPEALQSLYRLLGDPDHLVQREALQQLGNLRRKETLPALFARINGARGLNRMQLLSTLRLITGVDQGTSAERWQRWWKDVGEDFVVPPYEEAERAERERQRRRSANSTVSSFFGLQIVSNRICFVMDVSGSMQQRSKGGMRIDSAKKQLKGVLEQYPAGDLFNVIFFSSDVHSWEGKLVKMDDKARKDALQYVERQTPGGATAIYDALEMAFQDRRIDTIFLLTDGVPTGGTIDDPERIRAEVKLWNTSRHIRINCIAIGTDSPLLRGLAKDTGGEYRREN